MDRLEPEQIQNVNLLKTKLKSLSTDIKSIVEQGRLIERDATQLFLFKGMYREIKSYFDSFNETWDKMHQVFLSSGAQGAFPSESDKILQQNLKRYYYEACAIYESHMNPTPAASISNMSTIAANTASLSESRLVRARLPQINLPHFSGAQSDWPLFRDTFRSLIHDEASISNIEKFHFLISCLRGPALSLIKGVPLLETTYNQAWKILTDNFDDKRRLATSYLKVVLSYAPFKSRPTAQGLKNLITTVIENVAAFKLLNIPNSDDFILTYLVLRCLDPVTRREFEKEVSNLEFPTFEKLTNFLKSEWKSLDLTLEETLTTSTAPSSRPFKNAPRFQTTLLVDKTESTPKKSSTIVSSSSGVKCPICNAGHSLYHCNSFRTMSPAEKCAQLRNWKGCTNCLSSRHSVDDCVTSRRCHSCNQKHHSWLHIPDSGNFTSVSTSRPQAAALTGISRSGEVILGTAIASIRDSRGDYQAIRLVTDCGSQHSFITQGCARRLGLPVSSAVPSIAGIGQISLPDICGTLNCVLRPRRRRDVFSTDAIVVQDITGNLPHETIPFDLHIHFKAYDLADPTYWKPQEIDFLLGADLYYDIITGAPLSIREDLPKLVPSKLGFIVAGRCNVPSKLEPHFTSLFVQQKPDISDIMAKFWQLEESPKASTLTKEEIACEEHFKASHSRLPSGRYVVALPFKSTIHELQNPKHQVITRFMNLEHKLTHRPLLRDEYHRFMEDYVELGHMQPAHAPTRYLIPHHCVSKMEDGKTKLRVVFDASCCGNGGSLNDHLMVGPRLQRDIADIITAFRTYRVVLVADIVKMYRQILLRSEDRPYQHIVWRSDPKDELITMELMTITYGISSSSFLAIRSLMQLASDEGHRFPLAAKVLQDSIYVDDIVSGASDTKEALDLQTQLIELLRLGGFELGKWKSNSPELLESVREHVSGDHVSLSGSDDLGCKILGLVWFSSNDVFAFEVDQPKSPCTKRGILSAIARIYDPIGFLAPVVFKAKLILQDVWHARCDWDVPVPAEIGECWTTFANDLPYLSQLKIPRFISQSGPASYEIAGFSDASQRGYSAVIYLRASSSSSVKVHVLRSKTRLAPAKFVSIPRMELCGALLLTRLHESCRPSLSGIHVDGVYFFTDSTIVLGWLKMPLSRLKTFVANRVSEILETSSASSWHHVSSECNPADCASRGLMPQELNDHKLWWTGPQWLTGPSSSWPLFNSDSVILDLPEIKPISTISMLSRDTSTILQWMTRFSTFLKLLRSFAYALRFIEGCRQQRGSSDAVSLAELTCTRTLCIKLIQKQFISSNKAVTSSKYWASLSPFLDTQGIFRVGGRLEHSSLPYGAKHPVILPNSHFTRLLVDHYHRSYLHVGPASLQASLQNRFFILSARKIIRARVRQCVRCQMTNSKPKVPLMGNLPSFRLAEGQIFQNVGVDLGGPFLLKESNRRKAALGKAYLCLFICMVTKAVHLEIVSSCSTESFVAALHRFTSRRGRPRHIYSDCGTNFVGAASDLRELKIWYTSRDTQNDISSFLTKEEVEWHFNPPRSPHFGGIWEAGIKSAKKLLSRNISSTPLTFEELSTLMARIEAVLNSRPICPISSDSNNFECLTPGHFLIGRPLTALPEESLLDVKESTLRRWQLIQLRVQHFWSKWRSSYLNQLQQRRRWTNQHPNLQEGALVLINDAECPPTRWPMARVINTHPGADGIVRVATIQTPTGVYKRPVAKLVPLQLPDHE